jgi:acetyl-CoA C-acetyltransferase
MEDRIVIVGSARTPIGGYGGGLSSVPTHRLGSIAAQAAISRSGLEPDDVDTVIMGCIGQVGPQAYNARLVSVDAGIPKSSNAYNVNRLCGSGLQAILSAAMELQTRNSDIVVAGGNENMSAMPYLAPQEREGKKLGNRTLVDGTLAMLTDPWNDYLMGMTAENVAREYSIARDDQDAWAAQSQQRTATALAADAFVEEITPVEVAGRKGAVSVLDSDEHPRPDTTEEVLANLRPSFHADGTVTAGNSSGINDAGSATVVMRESDARARGLKPIARLVDWAAAGCDPALMGYAPVHAIPKALERAGMSIGDIDVVELNEAFAAQVVAVIRDANLDPDRTNPNGGAIALGHPVGATGTILTTKLIHDLHRRDLQTGMVTMCIGGGQALAAIFERM